MFVDHRSSRDSLHFGHKGKILKVKKASGFEARKGLTDEVLRENDSFNKRITDKIRLRQITENAKPYRESKEKSPWRAKYSQGIRGISSLRQSPRILNRLTLPQLKALVIANKTAIFQPGDAFRLPAVVIAESFHSVKRYQDDLTNLKKTVAKRAAKKGEKIWKAKNPKRTEEEKAQEKLAIETKARLLPEIKKAAALASTLNIPARQANQQKTFQEFEQKQKSLLNSAVEKKQRQQEKKADLRISRAQNRADQVAAERDIHIEAARNLHECSKIQYDLCMLNSRNTGVNTEQQEKLAKHQEKLKAFLQRTSNPDGSFNPNTGLSNLPTQTIERRIQAAKRDNQLLDSLFAHARTLSASRSGDSSSRTVISAPNPNAFNQLLQLPNSPGLHLTPQNPEQQRAIDAARTAQANTQPNSDMSAMDATMDDLKRAFNLPPGQRFSI